MKSIPKSALPALLAAFLAASPAHAQQAAAAAGADQSQWDALAREDVRLARIADTLLRANSGLCRLTMPVTGLILHSADQYRSGQAEARFVNGPLAISSLVPMSPAVRAGLLPDDAILAVGGQSVAALVPPEDGNLREAAFDLIASQPAEHPIDLLVARGVTQLEVSMIASAGCRTLVEILVGDGPRARSDGRVIQIEYGFAGELTDEQMAVVIAHELAHTVLEHRRRKEEAGIDNGLFAELGRNQRANRAAEVEADRLSIHLLANAGYDPASVPAFWRSDIGRSLGGSIPSFVYPSQEARAQLVEEEIARYLPLRRGPSWPGHLLALRDRSFRAD